MNAHVAFGDPSAALLQMYLDSRPERTTRQDLRRRQRRYQRGARLRKILG
jgi:hypothetical protein